MMRNKFLYTLALLFASLQTFAQSYTYDNLNRLTKVVYQNGTTVSYTYDELGNRTSKEVTGATVPPQAYAWLSSDGKTLTFCYDNEREERDGETFNLNKVGEIPDWYPGEFSSSSVTNVIFNPSFAKVKPTCTSYWFFNFNNLTEISGLNYLKTSEVTDMKHMFHECWNLNTLDLSHFDTSNVTDMSSMFSGCSFESLDVSFFNTSKVVNFQYMFQNCTSLTSLDISNFDTTNHNDSYSMLLNCNSLRNLIISSTMGNLDGGACYAIGTSSSPCIINAPEGFDFGIDTSGSYFKWKSGYFKLGNQKEAYAWLSSDGKTLTFCYDANREGRTGRIYDLNTEEWVAPDWDEGADVESNVSKVVFEPSFADARPIYTHYWFDGMSKLTEIEGLNYLNTSNVKRMAYMFNDCSSLSSLDLSNFDTSNVTDIEGMFKNCSGLKSLDLSSFNTSNVKFMGFMFCNCSSLENIELSCFDLSKVTETHFMFLNCRGLTSLDLSHFDTSNVTSSTVMLSNCMSLTNLCISSSMDNLNDDACNGIGMWYGPCTLMAPQGFDFGVDTSGSSFVWKSGIFKLAVSLGDVNDDGQTTISDVTALVNIIQGKDDVTPYIYDHDTADVNHDGSITAADVIELVNIILGKQQ